MGPRGVEKEERGAVPPYQRHPSSAYTLSPLLESTWHDFRSLVWWTGGPMSGGVLVISTGGCMLLGSWRDGDRWGQEVDAGVKTLTAGTTIQGRMECSGIDLLFLSLFLLSSTYTPRRRLRVHWMDESRSVWRIARSCLDTQEDRGEGCGGSRRKTKKRCRCFGMLEKGTCAQTRAFNLKSSIARLLYPLLLLLAPPPALVFARASARECFLPITTPAVYRSGTYRHTACTTPVLRRRGEGSRERVWRYATGDANGYREVSSGPRRRSASAGLFLGLCGWRMGGEFASEARLGSGRFMLLRVDERTKEEKTKHSDLGVLLIILFPLPNSILTLSLAVSRSPEPQTLPNRVYTMRQGRTRAPFGPRYRRRRVGQAWICGMSCTDWIVERKRRRRCQVWTHVEFAALRDGGDDYVDGVPATEAKMEERLRMRTSGRRCAGEMRLRISDIAICLHRPERRYVPPTPNRLRREGVEDENVGGASLVLSRALVVSQWRGLGHHNVITGLLESRTGSALPRRRILCHFGLSITFKWDGIAYSESEVLISVAFLLLSDSQPNTASTPSLTANEVPLLFIHFVGREDFGSSCRGVISSKKNLSAFGAYNCSSPGFQAAGKYDVLYAASLAIASLGI
ncbi:hypothetical protein R3P38DRAFT_2780081 [Favolaschia claudopus]|uniref:Uncharacterized protein n=1 Tax=Favolaschia claudopus TaxID=2862362 RepID=A0AAW0BBV8_9AGAR